MSSNSTNEIEAVIGANIASARAAAGMTQTEFGAALTEPCAAQQISKYELGVNSVSAAKLVDMAKTLNCTVASFFVGIEDFIADAAAPKRGDVQMLKNYQALSPAMQLVARNMVAAIVKETNDTMRGNV